LVLWLVSARGTFPPLLGGDYGRWAAKFRGGDEAASALVASS
jgi:hypothetical protein